VNNINVPYCRKCVSAFVLAFFTTVSVYGQEARMPNSIAGNSVGSATESAPTAKEPAVPQNVLSAMATLPEADSIVYLSPRRIISDAAPRVLAEKDLAQMREGLAQMKTEIGFDPSGVQYIVFQTRFRKPTADLNFSLPELIVVAGGDFDAEPLIAYAKNILKDKLHTESYGSRTIGIITIDEIAKQAEQTPFLKSYSEMAIASLNGNTIVAGTTNYVKAAIDARDGRGRINPDLLNSLMRDPAALASAAGSPWTAFAKTFALLGTENNPRTPKCDTKLGDYYASITMDEASFKFRGAMNADNPDTAKIIKSLLSSLLQQATAAIPDKNAQTVLSSLVITPTDNEVVVQADVSQQAVADFIREETKSKKAETTTKPVKPKPRRHRRVRRPARH
jgi:hypothetical protein